MKIIQFCKQLNNTELGKSATHDSYVHVPNEIDIADIFTTPNSFVDFFDPKTGEQITLRYTEGREKRIVGLGPFYRNNNLIAGDTIIFEKRIHQNTNEYLIKTQKIGKALVFKKDGDGYSCLTPEFLDDLESWGPRFNERIMVDLIGSIRKRTDSPEMTDIYKVKIDEVMLDNIIQTRKPISIRCNNQEIKVSSFFTWKKYIFNWE